MLKYKFGFEEIHFWYGGAQILIFKAELLASLVMKVFHISTPSLFVTSTIQTKEHSALGNPLFFFFLLSLSFSRGVLICSSHLFALLLFFIIKITFHKKISL